MVNYSKRRASAQKAAERGKGPQKYCLVCKKTVETRIDPRGSMLCCPHCRCSDFERND